MHQTTQKQATDPQLIGKVIARKQIRILTPLGPRRLITRDVATLPRSLRNLLYRSGVQTSEEVYSLILNGELRRVRHLGPGMEREVLRYFTYPA